MAELFADVNVAQAGDSYLQSLCIPKNFIFLKYEYETRFSEKDVLTDRVFLKKSQIGTSKDQKQPASLGDTPPVL